MFAQGACAFGKFRIVRHERATFAGGAEIFAGIKTEAGNFTERTDDFALYFAACDCAVSSTSGNLCFLQMAKIGSMSNGWRKDAPA